MGVFTGDINVKPLRIISILLVILFGAAGSNVALAQRHGGFGGPRIGLGINFGFPLYGPGYYAPYPYYPPPYYPTAAPYYPPMAVAPAAPPVYIERQEQPQSQPQAQVAQNDWFYCTDSKSFYPYVQQCASEWQRVPSHPPGR